MGATSPDRARAGTRSIRRPLLATSHYNPAMPVLPREWLELEYYGDDAHDLAGVARSPSEASTLHYATGGDPRTSPRWRSNMEMGGDQELIVALRTRAGEPWGGVGLYREPASRSSATPRSSSCAPRRRTSARARAAR